MRREIHRIEPWSAVRVGFFVGIFAGFLFGLFNGVIIKYFAGMMGDSVMPRDMMNMNLSDGAIMALAIIMSLISSLIFAALGAVMAVFYNIIASLFGGLEVMVKGEEPAASLTPSHTRDEEEEPGHE